MNKRFEPHPATTTDLGDIVQLLKSHGLPHEPLPDLSAGAVTIVRSGQQLTGMAAVEVRGCMGLLRSVAVHDSYRGSLMGTRLVEDRIRWATKIGITRLYLLTTTASAFFRKLGFTNVSRDHVPEGIASTEEFASQCPQSATVMELNLVHYVNTSELF